MWYYNYTFTDELYHHGILGQKWGVRRFQNKDGTLTSVGKKRYGSGLMPSQKKQGKDESYNKINAEKDMSKREMRKYLKKNHRKMDEDSTDFSDEYDETPEGKSLLKSYNKAYDKYFNSNFENEEEESKAEEVFLKAEEKLLRAEMEYTGKKMVEKYGNDLTYNHLKGNYKSIYDFMVKGKDAVKAYSDEWWIHAV